MKDADKNLPIVFGQHPNQSEQAAEQQDSAARNSTRADSAKQAGTHQASEQTQSTNGYQQDAYNRGYQEGYEHAQQTHNRANTHHSQGSDMSNKNFTYLLYGLFIGGYFTGGLTTIAALVLAYAKRSDVVNTIYYSHMENIIHSFWMTLFVGILAYFLILTFILAIIGWPLIALLFIWTCYRMIKGFIRISENRAYN